MRVAIAHDYLTQRGGAERVVLALHRMFPEAPIYTSVYDAAGTFEELGAADVRTGFLQRVPGARRHHRAFLPLYPMAFGRIRLRGYDVVVSSSSGWAHGVDAGDALHLCYCHTPARWLYRTKHYLGDGGPLPSGAALPLVPLLGALRRWDARAARRPDVYLANSTEVARRIRAIYGRDAEVVPPPVDANRFAAAEPVDEGYYLVVARLLPYKRVDLAVQACEARGARLVVVGDGPARARLEAAAGDTVEFAGRVDEARLLDLYRGCRALIQPGEEDFGIAPLEANAAGKPVVAFGAGGALDSVVDGESGVLFARQTAEALGAALDRVESRAWDARALRAHAAGFSEAAFARRLRGVISDRLGVAA